MYSLLRMIALCTLMVSFATPALAQGKKDPAKPAAEKKGKMPPGMEAMMKAAAVGPEHEVLKQLAGTFTAASSTWVAPRKPPIKAKGQSLGTMVLGDRFVMQEYTSTMMGKPFEGRGFTGYDNLKKKYVSIWMDTMMTSIMPLEGTLDESGKVLTLEGDSEDPATGKVVKMRFITKIESKDKHVWEMHRVLGEGKAIKAMEIVYTRKSE